MDRQSIPWLDLNGKTIYNVDKKTKLKERRNYMTKTNYSETDRSEDFKFFTDNYDKFFAEYGHKFLVIKNKKVIGQYDSVSAAISNTPFPAGEYIVQECDGSSSAYTSRIMRLMISG